MVLANKQVRPSESRPQTKLSSKTSRQSSREESESLAVPDPVGEIHEDFRLFLITRADSPNRIPGQFKLLQNNRGTKHYLPGNLGGLVGKTML